VDGRRIVVAASPGELWAVVSRIGGSTGWYYGDWLWQLRGVLDRLVGGVGLNRGRRDAAGLQVGDALDFWRVASVDPGRRLLLVAEMRLPGQAVLEFSLQPSDDGRTELRQTARFLPRGLWGLLYWYAVLPFHGLVFNGMLRGIAEAVDRPLLAGPERVGSRPGQRRSGR
jgi:hypothetical protein